MKLTAFVDANHGHDLLTRRSVTGILILLNNTPIRWISKKQKTVETSSYGSELVASRIACEAIQELRYHLRNIGVPIDGPTDMIGDNMSVILNTSVPSSMLKKKHNAIAYHRVRECIAAGIIRSGYTKSDDNLSDVLTKPLDGPQLHKLVKPFLFRQPSHVSGKKIPVIMD